MSIESDSNDTLVQQQLRERMLSQSGASWLIGMICLMLGAFTISQHVPLQALGAWTGIGTGVLILRLVCYLRFKHGHFSRFDLLLYEGILACLGLVWGCFSLFVTPAEPLVVQILILTTPLVMCASMVLTLSSLIPEFSELAIPLLASFTVAMFFGNEGSYRQLLPIVILYGCFCLAFAQRLNRQTRDTLSLKIANEQLVKDLSEQNRHLSQAREQAVAAVATKDAFLSRMSHELRTPMNGVMGMAQALSSTSLDPRQLQYLSTLQLSAHRLLGLINDLLDATSLASDNVQIREEPTPVSAITGLLSDNYARAFADEGLYFRVSIDDDVPTTVSADRFRVNQMLRKLIDNALKFTEHGGVVLTVSQQSGVNPRDTKCKELQFLTFTICDTGVGIDAAHLAMVSDAFHQADSSTERRFEGSGLGLSLVSSLAALMSGTLRVRSELGKGTTVTVQIPLNVVADDPAPVLKQVDIDLIDATVLAGNEPVRVLVAEDNPVNQMVLESMLEDFECVITLADDGNEAVECMNSAHFDIVFMDCQMPDCDGYEATRQARQTGISTPIVAVTANTMAGDRQKCLDAGMDDYMAKPLTSEALESMLATWLPNHFPQDKSRLTAA